MTVRALLALSVVVLAACVTFHGVPPEEIMGQGHHRYAWDGKWPEVVYRTELGPTHGEIAVDGDGLIHVTTDTEAAVVVFDAEGEHVRSWGREYKNGLHGLRFGTFAGRDVLFLSHTRLHAVLAVTPDGGEVVWSTPHPEASGLYEQGDEFKPTNTAQAPDGRIFITDGYGKGYVHRYSAEGEYLGSFGGPGTEPGRFRTPHGVWVDTRGPEPTLLVADRENHRLQRFDLEGELLEVIVGPFLRPCMIHEQDGDLVVADLAGRVTILDEHDRPVTHLGPQPDPEKQANYGVPVEQWRPRQFTAPHSAAWTPDGHLIVMDWNATGRISRLRRLD